MRKLLVISVIALVFFLSAPSAIRAVAIVEPVYAHAFSGSSTERWVQLTGKNVVGQGIGTYTADVIIEVYSNNTVLVSLSLWEYVDLFFNLDLRMMRQYPNGMVFITASKIINTGTVIERYSVVIFVYPNGVLKMQVMETYIYLNSFPTMMDNYVNYVTANMVE